MDFIYTLQKILDLSTVNSKLIYIEEFYYETGGKNIMWLISEKQWGEYISGDLTFRADGIVIKKDCGSHVDLIRV